MYSDAACTFVFFIFCLLETHGLLPFDSIVRPLMLCHQHLRKYTGTDFMIDTTIATAVAAMSPNPQIAGILFSFLFSFVLTL